MMTTPPVEQLGSDDLPVVFGRYRLLRVLGQGGMGRVFAAELCGTEGFRKAVALKVIRRPDEGSAARASFLREARYGGLLRHPNVVDVYDFGVTEGRPWIAMELVAGRPLSQVLRDLGLPHPGVVLDLAIHITEGLAHAHALPVDGRIVEVVHRDLKPENVLVTDHGGVKLLDFGLARAAGVHGETTQSAVVCGTPAYMSPEQATADVIDGRSDLFALGTMLHELLTGERMHQATSLVAVLMSVVNLEDRLDDDAFFARAEARLPGVTPLLRRLLRRDRDRRYPSARALLTDLKAMHRATPGTVRDWLEGRTPAAAAITVGLSEAVVPPTLPSNAIEPADTESLPPEALSHLSRSTGGPRRRTNLPLDDAEFVGREADLDALGRLDSNTRLVSIVGPGGLGKTRLAMRYAAGRLQGVADGGGSWFVDLREVRDGPGIAHAVAAAVNAPPEVPGRSAVAFLGDVLADRGAMMLVLDGFEHLVGDAEVVATWLAAAPSLQVVVTTRERLRLPGEQVYEPSALPQEEAIELFSLRARSARVGWSLSDADRPVVAELVHRLDGLPLAIELAAARIAVLPPQRILDRLTERFRLLARPGGGRAATLEGTIRWSWDLLDSAEQSAFAQCSVFRGSFSIEAAEAVLDLSAFGDAPWPLDVVHALRDKSLLRSEEPEGLEGELRFSMYESLREFALCQLAAEEMEALRRRHADWACRWAVAAERDTGRSRAGARRFRLETDNLIAATEFATERGLVELAAPAADAICRVSALSGPYDRILLITAPLLANAAVSDADRVALRLRRATAYRIQGRLEDSLAELEAAEHEAPAVDRAPHLHGWIQVTRVSTLQAQGELTRAREAIEAAEALGARVDDAILAARLVASRAILEGYAGNQKESAAHHRRSLELHRSLGDIRQVAVELNSLAIDAAMNDEVDEAVDLFRKAQRVFRHLGSRRRSAMVSTNLAVIAAQRGRLAAAEQSLRSAKRTFRELGDRQAHGIALTNLALVLVLLENEGALEAARQGLDTLRALGDQNWYAGVARHNLAMVQMALGRLDEAVGTAEITVERLRGSSEKRRETSFGLLAAMRYEHDRLDEGRSLAKEGAGRSTDEGSHPFMAMVDAFALLSMARAASRAGHPERAEQLREDVALVAARCGLSAEQYSAKRPLEADTRVLRHILEGALRRDRASGDHEKEPDPSRSDLVE